MRERAAQIAALGYVALAVDMYGEGKIGSSPDEAGALMTTVLNDMEIGTARLQAAFDVLADHALVDNARIGATGYCFGGAMVLHMARIGMPLRAVVSFHGALGSFHKPAVGEVKAKILVCHGAADSLVPDDDVANFKLEMHKQTWTLLLMRELYTDLPVEMRTTMARSTDCRWLMTRLQTKNRGRR